MTDDLERRLVEHHRRLDPEVAPLALFERLDKVIETAPLSRRRPIWPFAAVAAITVSLVGVALVASWLVQRPGPVGREAPPTSILGEPVLAGAAVAERASADGGSFVAGGWIVYFGSTGCRSEAEPDVFDGTCPDGWYLVDRDPYGDPRAPTVRLRLAIATDVGMAVIHDAVVLHVHALEHQPGTCATAPPGCEPLLAVDALLWADRLALHVDNRSSRPITVSIVAASAADEAAPTEVTLASNASIDMAAAMADVWAVEVDGRVVIDSRQGSPAGPILVAVDAAGVVSAQPLVP